MINYRLLSANSIKTTTLTYIPAVFTEMRFVDHKYKDKRYHDSAILLFSAESPHQHGSKRKIRQFETEVDEPLLKTIQVLNTDLDMSTKESCCCSDAFTHQSFENAVYLSFLSSKDVFIFAAIYLTMLPNESKSIEFDTLNAGEKDILSNLIQDTSESQEWTDHIEEIINFIFQIITFAVNDTTFEQLNKIFNTENLDQLKKAKNDYEMEYYNILRGNKEPVSNCDRALFNYFTELVASINKILRSPQTLPKNVKCNQLQELFLDDEQNSVNICFIRE